MKRWVIVTLFAGAGLAACRQADPSNADNESMIRGDSDNRPAATTPAAPEEKNGAKSPPAPARTSRYSSLRKDNCSLAEQSDEGPYWRMRCNGVGGYAVDYTESDLRQGIAVIAPGGGGQPSLEIPAKVAKGAFDRLGPTIEWRGDAGKAPDALIVRVDIAREGGGPDRSVLAVASLAPTPCVIGVVEPGAGQNARAQAMADKGGNCL